MLLGGDLVWLLNDLKREVVGRWVLSYEPYDFGGLWIVRHFVDFRIVVLLSVIFIVQVWWFLRMESWFGGSCVMRTRVCVFRSLGFPVGDGCTLFRDFGGSDLERYCW